MDDADSIVLRPDGCIILFSMNTECQPHVLICPQCQTHTESWGRDQNSVSDSEVILYRRWGSDRRGVMASDLLLWPGEAASGLAIQSELYWISLIHLIFHSNFIKNPRTGRRPAPSAASQNWNLKLTRIIEMEMSNINEFSVNFIDKLRLFWSVTKVSVLLWAFTCTNI